MWCTWGSAHWTILLRGMANSYSLCSCLQHELPDLLDNMPLTTWAGMYFWHDGALLCISTDNVVLNQHFPGHYTGCGGPLNWLPQSTDLNCFNFNIWNILFMSAIWTYTRTSFISDQEILHCIIHSVAEWAKIYTEAKDGYFEHLSHQWKSRVSKIVYNH